MHAVAASLALSLLYVSKDLLHLVLNCMVSSLVTPALRCNRLKSLESFPGTGNWYTVLSFDNKSLSSLSLSLGQSINLSLYILLHVDVSIYLLTYLPKYIAFYLHFSCFFSTENANIKPNCIRKYFEIAMESHSVKSGFIFCRFKQCLRQWISLQ